MAGRPGRLSARERGAAAFCLLLALSTAPLRAQRPGWLFDGAVGGIDAGTTSGGLVAAGLAWRAGPLVIAARPADLILYKGGTDPYYWDDVGSGDRVCRNGDNGQFASEDKCSPVRVDYGVSGDASLVIPGTRLMVGAGGRLAAESRWYGTAAFAFGRRQSPAYYARVSVGRRYVSAAVGIFVGL